MLDPVDFGKAMAAIVNNATAPLLKRIEQLESRQLIRGDKGEPGDRGADAPAVTGEEIYTQVSEYLAEHPPAAGEKGERGEQGIRGQNGKDADPIDLPAVVRAMTESEDLLSFVKTCVKEEVARIPIPKDGEKGERGDKGDEGVPGRNGKDAEPIDVRAVIRGLLESDDLQSRVELHIKEEVHRIPNPKDGEKGERGEKGADGAGIADLLIDRDGNLVATLTDGRMKSLGVVCGKDGQRGTDGKDGADFSGFDVDYDGERTLTIRGKGGDIAKRLPIPIDRGYWRAGTYQKADVVTEGGTAYIAQTDTKEKPSLSSADWRIFARKGRDGKDGRNGIDKTQPTKLKDSVDA